MSYCNDVDCLMKTSGQDSKHEEWRLLTDASKVSLKGVLSPLHGK
jgi:hypothetical protein